MTDTNRNDSTQPGQDMRSRTDALRSTGPVHRGDAGEWVLLSHADVLAAAQDHVRFSSNVSRHLQIPNGLDGETHRLYRALIDRHLGREALDPFLPLFEQVATGLVAELPRGVPVDAVGDFGAVFAVRAQCAWLGWPRALEPTLLEWMAQNHAATRSGDRSRMAEVADRFDQIIRSVVRPRRAAGSAAFQDVTARLCRDQIDGRLLTEAELVSILRNWTGGDLGSLALCIGVIVMFVIQRPEIAAQLRSAPDVELEAAIDEILRLDDPFVSNRRVTTCPVRIGQADLSAGARVILNWISANRDEARFGDNRFDPQGNAAANLVYGAGKHVCPGRLLATCELRIAVRALLNSVSGIDLAPDQPPERELPPVGGYRRVPVILT